MGNVSSVHNVLPQCQSVQTGVLLRSCLVIRAGNVKACVLD